MNLQLQPPILTAIGFTLLHSLPVDELRRLGMRPWEKPEPEQSALMLIPAAWEESIPDALIVTDIFLEDEAWRDVKTMGWNPICGMLPFGVLAMKYGRTAIPDDTLEDAVSRKGRRPPTAPLSPDDLCADCLRPRANHFVAAHCFRRAPKGLPNDGPR